VLLIVLLLFFLPTLTKGIGGVLFFLPGKLGVAPEISSASIQMLSRNGLDSTVTLDRGSYAIYTEDETLLRGAMGGGTPWLTVSGVEGEIPVSSVRRGLRPYDTALVPGRPIYHFTIEERGAYRLFHPSRDTPLSVVPFYTPAQEQRIWLSYLAQVAIVVLPVAAIRYRRHRARDARRRVVRQAKRALLNEMLERTAQEGSRTRE
jgi:hypothetical protein